MTATIGKAYITTDPDRPLTGGKLVVMHTGEAMQEIPIPANEADQIEPKELIGLTLYEARQELIRQRYNQAA